MQLSEAEQKNMMAYYYRKQEELKRLEENEDDEYLASQWADPKSLKHAFTGMRDVKWNLK
jgi:cilia- and flagella-associated protein 298